MQATAHADMFIDNSEDEACQLCEKKIHMKDYPTIVYKALGRKYCTNLNQFFYIKDINKVLQNTRSKAVIDYYEWEMDKAGQECLKRQYQKTEFEWKIERISHFYRDQQNKPKVYIKEVMDTLRQYYYYQEKIRTSNGRPALVDDPSDTQIHYSDFGEKDNMNNNSNILQNSNRILSAIDKSTEQSHKRNHNFSGLSSISQENVLYYQSRIYFNMFSERKESDDFGYLLGKSPEETERPTLSNQEKHQGQLVYSKQSGSSHPNNSTNTHLHNANFSESSRLFNDQLVLKRNAGAAPPLLLNTDEKFALISDFGKKDQNFFIGKLSSGQVLRIAPKLQLTGSDARTKKSTGKQTPIGYDHRASNNKKLTPANLEEPETSQEKKLSKSKESKSRHFDYKWLKIANKTKKPSPGASSKKKSLLCKSGRLNDVQPEHFKTFSMSRLIPKLSLISKENIACTDRSPLPSKRKMISKHSQSKANSKKSKRELPNKRSIKNNSESNTISQLLMPNSSLSRDKIKHPSRSNARLQLKASPISSANLFTKTNSIFNSTSRLKLQAQLLKNDIQVNRKREFSKSLHEKVLNKITACHERLSSNGLHPKELGQFNLDIFKESWLKNTNRPLKTMRNLSSSRLEGMHSLTHRRNLSSLSKKSPSDLEKPNGQKISQHKKKPSVNHSKENSERPVMALLNMMNADMTRLRHSVALEGYKHLKKTTPVVSKHPQLSQKRSAKQS